MTLTTQRLHKQPLRNRHTYKRAKLQLFFCKLKRSAKKLLVYYCVDIHSIIYLHHLKTKPNLTYKRTK